MGFIIIICQLYFITGLEEGSGRFCVKKDVSGDLVSLLIKIHSSFMLPGSVVIRNDMVTGHQNWLSIVICKETSSRLASVYISGARERNW